MPTSDSVLSASPNDPLEMFEAFLQYMRSGSAPRPSAPRAPTTAPEEPPEERTTKITQAVPGYVGPDDPSAWDEPTRSRPDVARELARQTARKVEPEQSIIVDDDLSMTQPVQPSGPDLSRVVESRSERFCEEMLVLIKYGHAGQVPREIERWVKAFPDEIEGLMRISEFEMQRVDGSVGLDRLFAVANRALERGAVEHLRRALERLQAIAAGDMRLAALRARLGLR